MTSKVAKARLTKAACKQFCRIHPLENSSGQALHTISMMIKTSRAMNKSKYAMPNYRLKYGFIRKSEVKNTCRIKSSAMIIVVNVGKES